MGSYERTCKKCGKPFTTDQAAAKYCSDDCRPKSRNEYPSSKPPSGLAHALAVTGSAVKKMPLTSNDLRHKTKKYSPERLRTILNNMATIPVKTFAARSVDISPGTIDDWLNSSAQGHPAFQNLEWNGRVAHFHDHFKLAMATGDDRLEETAFHLAHGTFKTQSVFQGRVIYKSVTAREYEVEVDLGLREKNDWTMYDEHGRPIPEEVTKQDPEMVRMLLQARKARIYGKHQQIDVNYSGNGGVLVVTMPKTPVELEEAHGGMRDVQDVDFEEIKGIDDDNA